jgi:hypothetical protein
MNAGIVDATAAGVVLIFFFLGLFKCLDLAFALMTGLILGSGIIVAGTIVSLL